jgi:hypothetical protein
MIAAGVNAKALSTFMGHANISINLDRYGHPMPGSEEDAASRLNSYRWNGLNTQEFTCWSHCRVMWLIVYTTVYIL